jgi:hypothetical protein
MKAGGQTAPPVASAVDRARLRVLSAFADAIWPSQRAEEGANASRKKFFQTSGAFRPEVASEVSTRRVCLGVWTRRAQLRRALLHAHAKAGASLGARHAVSRRRPSACWCMGACTAHAAENGPGQEGRRQLSDRFGECSSWCLQRTAASNPRQRSPALTPRPPNNHHYPTPQALDVLKYRLMGLNSTGLLM